MSERIPAQETLAEILAAAVQLRRELQEYVEALNGATADGEIFDPHIAVCITAALCTSNNLGRLVSPNPRIVSGWPLPETVGSLGMVDKALGRLKKEMPLGSESFAVVSKLQWKKGQRKSAANMLIVDSIDDWPRPSERVEGLLDGAIERLTAVLMLDEIQPDKKPHAEAISQNKSSSNGGTEAAKQLLAVNENQLSRLAGIVGDENAVEITAIANRKAWSGERKMAEILQIDVRFASKKSDDWGLLLGVTGDAVRGWGLWKKLQEAKEKGDVEQFHVMLASGEW